MLRSLVEFLIDLDTTKKVVIFGRTPGARDFYARPGVVVVDDSKMRFRNFTKFRVRIEADFLKDSPYTLEKAGDKNDRAKLELKPSLDPGFREYKVFVAHDGGEVEAIGDSRPGAIIDR